ncbi:glycosyltransferase [Glutamicibacter ardleyensis]|uniref:Glycosyltransferase n=1 Tax=Glutamicibacter ardleyensis TaxID=225894 RepID=A0ABQ2DS43_9MICC|nr:glycosyltransferase [Glutamicibacter ardleyensis]GGJ70808.1 hypothetical protein GCM10007173_32050 [Glutamicibacter ardleyensis]
MRQIRDAIVVIPGTRWENTQGTDHRLAEALSKHFPVLWVDPPVPLIGPAVVARPTRKSAFQLDPVQEGITRLRYLVSPGFTRPGIEVLTRYLRDRAIRKTLAEQGLRVQATVLLSPRDEFPKKVGGKRLLHVTDNWVSGAEMMGLNPHRVAARLKKNLASAHVVSVVSPFLGEVLAELQPGLHTRVVPNGCRPLGAEQAQLPVRSSGNVVLLGQLNERLDFEILDSLVAAGHQIDVVGPRRERDPQVSRQLDQFLGAANVFWHGEVKPSEVPPLIGAAAVGITPYLDNAFNKASFPLKTLDYLAAGLPVVSTDSPAVRWLDTDLVKIADTPRDFVRLVGGLVAQAPDAQTRQRLIDFASLHSWESRAASLIELSQVKM